MLVQAREAVLAEAVEALDAARLRHYRASGATENEERLQALFDVFADSARARSVLPMVRHAERIARERHESGFDLAEVQTAFNVLEEALWRRITATLPPEDYPEAYGLVSTVLGAGKEAVALRYVELARRAGSPVIDVKALFAGV